jgi:hypothetical protein
VGDVLDLHVLEQLKQAASLRCVESASAKLGNPPFLVGNVPFAFGNMPLGFPQEMEVRLAIQHSVKTDWALIGSTRRIGRNL